MCCIFTLLGWILDMVQKCWTFAMSAIIFSAIACTLLTASASGVALGYNYSMAEFIQLRETNVSVYLKRGVFDDEVADEMSYRRKEGGLPSDSEGSSNEYAGRSGNSGPKARASIFDTQDEGPVPGGSRFESDEHHRFEGSLIRLTAKPPSTNIEIPTNHGVSNNVFPAEVRRLYDNTVQPPVVVTNLQKVNSMDEVKAMQDFINERKLAMKQGRPTQRSQAPYTYPAHASWPIEYPPSEKQVSPDARRKLYPGILEEDVAQDAEQRAKWYQHLTTPVEVTYELTLPRRGPLQPLRKRPTLPPEDPIAEPSTIPLDADSERQESLKKALETLRIVPDSSRDEEPLDSIKLKPKDYISQDSTNDNIKDYEEDDLKGLPVRRKRSITQVKETKHLKSHDPTNTIENTLYNENSLFGKFMSILRNGEAVREEVEIDKSEIVDKNESIVAKSTPSKVTQEKIESFSKMFTSTTSSVILKILKSNLITR